MASDIVRVAGLSVPCIVGIHPRERLRPQPVMVDLELALDLEEAGRDGRFLATVDYAGVAQEVTFLLSSGRFRLLETAARAIALVLLLPPVPEERRARVDGVTVRLRKPEALRGHGVPEVEIRRDAAWARVPAAPGAFGTVEVLQEAPDGRVERLRFSPGLAVTETPPPGRWQAHFVRGGQVLVDDAPRELGAVPHGSGAAHRWHNPGPGSASILRVEAPFPEPGAVPTPRGA